MNDFKFEETIGYWMLHLARAYRTGIQSRLTDLGLYVGQDLLLMQLWRDDGQTQSELADKLQIQGATLTRMLTRMSQAGFIKRKPDPGDGRISRVYITPAGVELQEPVMAIWQDIEAQTFADLTLEERLLVRRLLMQALVDS